MRRSNLHGILGVAAVAVAILGPSACGAVTSDEERRGAAAGGVQTAGSPDTGTSGTEPDAGAQARCETPVPVYEDGARVREVCPGAAADAGLTVVDLSDAWAARVFSEDPEMGEAGRQPYLPAVLALADERLGDLPRNVPAERFLELYGIFPTFRVLAARLADEERHRCHDAVEDQTLEQMDRTIRPWGADLTDQRARLRRVSYMRNMLERARRARGVESIAALADDPEQARLVARYDEDRIPVEAVSSMQAHLRCDGLLRGRYLAGVFDWRTAAALKDFQRMHAVVSAGLLDEPTRTALALPSRDADFHAMLRALRERVVDASGLIEDGSAQRRWGTILGRDVDPPEFHADGGQPALPNGAPDLVSPATEAAARAFGWTSPEAFVSSHEALAQALGERGRVAVRLPAAPSYHSRHMELRAELDRGDVYYGAGGGRVEHRPVITLYARDGGRDVALIRWSTTIGGWKPEVGPEGVVGLRYKNSPVGPVIWRDVIASPAWLPPPSSPDDELVTRFNGRWVPNHALFGPGYRSAYGLAMVMHHKVIPPREEGGETRYFDEGIRVHGSVSYRSILQGYSHGCHRLYNHLAVRLASFLIAHRNHVRRGSLDVQYSRRVMHEGVETTFRITSRGYHFELTPPVQMEVLEGNVRGPVHQPPQGFRALPQEIVQQVAAEAAEDG